MPLYNQGVKPKFAAVLLSACSTRILQAAVTQALESLARIGNSKQSGSMLWHPMLVHIPIALALLAPFAGGLALLLTHNQPRMGRTAWISLVVGQVLLVGTIYAALATGENDEEYLSAAEPANHAVIHEHEERAEFFFITAIAVTALSLLGLKENRYVKLVRAATVLAQCALLFLCIWTAHAGGQLVHVEGLSRYALEHKAASTGAGSGKTSTTPPAPEADAGTH